MILIDIGTLTDSKDHLGFVCDIVGKCADSRVIVTTMSGDGVFTKEPCWSWFSKLTAGYEIA